jgi:hypothetical protein
MTREGRRKLARTSFGHERVALVAMTVVLLGAARAGAECNTSICATATCTIKNTHDLDPGCELDFTGKAVTIDGTATLRTTNGNFFTIRAKSLVMNGTLKAPNGEITIIADGDFSMIAGGSLIDTSSGNDQEWGTVDITAGGTATLRKIVTNGVGYGGDLTVEAGTVVVNGPVQADGASHAASGLTGEGGYVWLIGDLTSTTPGDVDVTGTISASGVGSDMGDGGTIDLRPDGDLHLVSGSLLRSTGVNGGSGGDLWIVPSGKAFVDGNLVVDSSGPDAYGGSITVWPDDAATSSSNWSANGGSGSDASAGWIDFLSGYSSVQTSSSFSMQATTGGGGRGGQISVDGATDVVLAGKIDVSTGGPSSQGGWISITGEGMPGTVAVSAVLDVTSSTATGADGQIWISGCTVTLSGTAKAKAGSHTGGANNVGYTGTLTVTPTGKLLAGPVGGNNVSCPCTGADVIAKTCASPLACAAPPTTPSNTTSVVPALRLQPIATTPCTCFDKTKESPETDVDCGGGACPGCGTGRICVKARDCQDGICTAGKCQMGSCGDGVQNGTETDVDCGGSCSTKCPDGEHCHIGKDCVSNACDQSGICRPLGCIDLVKDGTETDIDCGGAACPTCKPGKHCGAGSDCDSGICKGGTCQTPSCTDGVKNGTEPAADCGDGCPNRCKPGQPCLAASDCDSSVCMTTCQTPACPDGVKNGTETDVDCGGPNSCARCGDGQECQDSSGSDCTSKVCNGGACQTPTCMDGVLNQDETDVDCGGSCQACKPGQGCVTPKDCDSKVCDPTTRKCDAPTCTDTVQNGKETDVDCGGGSSCPEPKIAWHDLFVNNWLACIESVCPTPCADGQHCKGPADCNSGVCMGGTCAPGTCTDGVWNGDEAWTDCGGSCPNLCADGSWCNVGTWCASHVCRSHRCATASCTDGVKNENEGDVDCGAACTQLCEHGQTCNTSADCETGFCDGTCKCPDQDFKFTVQSSRGGSGIDYAHWPGDQQTQGTGGCTVTINDPDNIIHYVCSTLGTRPFSVDSVSGFSSCQGTGGDDGDGCGDVSCPIASYGQCCNDRPSCSSALNGIATASFNVHCNREP